MNPIRWFYQVCSVTLFSLGLVVAGALASPTNTTPKQLASAPKFVESQGTASVSAVLPGGVLVLCMHHGTTGSHLLVAPGPDWIDFTGYFPKEGDLVVFRWGGQDRFDDVVRVTPGLGPQLSSPDARL